MKRSCLTGHLLTHPAAEGVHRQVRNDWTVKSGSDTVHQPCIGGQPGRSANWPASICRSSSWLPGSGSFSKEYVDPGLAEIRRREPAVWVSAHGINRSGHPGVLTVEHVFDRIGGEKIWPAPRLVTGIKDGLASDS